MLVHYSVQALVVKSPSHVSLPIQDTWNGMWQLWVNFDETLATDILYWKKREKEHTFLHRSVQLPDPHPR